MERKREKGAIVIEATISLTAFIFAMLMILSLVDIAYVQAKMGVALNSAAKEISQYSYLYYKFNLDEFDASLSDGTEKSKKTVENTIDGVGELINSLSEVENSIPTMEFDRMFKAIEDGAGSANQMINMYAEQISEDPKGFIVGMGKLAGSELKEEAKAVLGQVMAKAFMKKNLKASAEQEADAFLKKYHVVDGMDGLDFNYTTLMAYGTSNEIHLVVTYEVEIVQLLNVDFKFKFQQCAKTSAWGNGVSVITPRSIWDTMTPVNRGKYIAEKEKENYPYTSDDGGFQAFDNSGGKNEFVAITSMDTSMSSYKDKSGVKNRLNSIFNKMYSEVNGMGNPITVKNALGEEVTVSSDPASRTYKIVLIIPEGADQSVIKAAIEEFKKSRPGEKIEVQIKEGYGDKKAEGWGN